MVPITEGLAVVDHVMKKSVDGGNLALRIYIPNDGSDTPDSYPTML